MRPPGSHSVPSSSGAGVGLDGWDVGGGPLFRRLARAVGAAIERGDLAPGDRLPSERALARSAAVSRGVVVAAYDDLLGAGLVERRHGSGTYVSSSLDPPPPPGREGSALVARLVERSLGAGEVVDLSLSVLHDAEGMPQVSIGTADLVELVPDTGYSPWGLPALRAALAAEATAAGLPTGPDQVVVTGGAQQGLAAAIACWVRPGDVVVVEDPTYPGVLAALATAGAVVRPVPVDRHGVRPEPLAAVLADRPALVHLQPPLHSPTGAVLSAARWQAVVDLVVGARVPLVEDRALADLSWGRPPAPLAAHAPDHPIAVVGSLSKRWWGGLRLGWVRAPGPVAGRIARVKATQDLGTSAVAQGFALRLLDHPDAAPALAARVADLRHRHDVLAAELGRRLPTWRWTTPAGGLSLWVRLPAPVAADLAVAALDHGVAVATADGLSAAPGWPDHLRLSFAAPPAALREGVARLAAAWSTVAPAR